MHLHLASAPRVALGSSPAQTLAALDAALLAWLALEGPTPRARLAQLLWPEKDAEAARNSLRQRLFQLRRALGAELVVGSTVLALADGATHDLDDADSVLGEVAGETLAAGEFSAWLAQQRERRRGRMRRSLVELADVAEAAKDWDDALAHAGELLALEPLSEDAHRRVMRLHYLRGDRAAALLAFDRCERVLKDEVGARPSGETLALLATIESVSVGAVARDDGPVPASVLRPPRMVGRERELAQLEQGWRAGQVVALVGEAGMGKTRLLQDFIASRPGVVIAAGRPGDGGVPFATLARLLRAVMARDEVAALPAPARGELARVLPEIDPALPRPGGEGQRLVLQHAVRDLLHARRGLDGLIVDDLHFADEASLDMIGALIDHAGDDGSHAMRWALAHRPAEAGTPVRALHDALVDQARLLPVALAPLGAAQLAELVDLLGLPGVRGDALAPGLLRRTGGNPLFVLETLKQAWVERTLAQLADASQLPRPLSVGRLIERRIGQLSAGALALARVAAIAGVDFDIALAEHVLGVSALQFADAINELESAQVLRGIAFAHDLVHDAVLASVPGSVARHVHAQVAGWMEGHGGEAARIAQHWIDAGRDAQALPWLQRAAEAARHALRGKEFIAFMERRSAIQAALGERPAAFESLFGAVEDFRKAGHAAEVGLALCDRLDALASTPHQQVQALMVRGQVLNEVGRFPQAPAVLEQALRAFEAAAIDDAGMGARLRRQLGVAYLQVDRAGDALRMMQLATDWIDHHGSDAERSDLHGDIASTLDNLGRIDEALPHHQRGYELALRLGDVGNLSVSCGNLTCNRMDAGDLAAADAAAQRGMLVVAAHDDYASYLGGLQMMRCLVLAHLGRFGDALLQGELAVESMRRFQPGLVVRARVRLAQCWWHLGQWARLAALLDETTPGDADALPVHVMHARLRWQYAAAHRGEAVAAEHARARLRQALAELDAAGERPDLALPLRIDLVDVDAVDAALRELDAVAQAARRIGHLGTAQAAHLRAAGIATPADPRRARAHAQAALALAAQERTNTVLRPAELWLQAGRALQAAGDEAAADVLSAGRDWLQRTAREQVPEPYRDGFVGRVPEHRELLALAARHAP